MKTLRVLVITRHLPGFDPVIQELSEVPDYVVEDGYGSLCRDSAEHVKESFCRQYPEFRQATFRATVHPLHVRS